MKRVKMTPLLLNKVISLHAENERLSKENDTLRGLLGSSAKPCTYCNLPAEDQAKCAHGFPGCRATDKGKRMKVSNLANWKWSTAAGLEIAVWDMSDSHLHNALAWVRREPDMVPFCLSLADPDFDFEPWEKDGYSKEEWIDCFNKEIERRSRSKETP